jgi:hypothetical protein
MNIAIIVTVTAGGIVLGIIIACLAYHKWCKNGKEIKKEIEYTR